MTYSHASDISLRIRNALLGATDEDVNGHPAKEPDQATADLTFSRIQAWLSDVVTSRPDVPQPPSDEQQDVVVHDDGDGPAKPQPDFFTILLQQHYRETVFSSVAYQWLVSSLQRQVLLSLVGESGSMTAVRSKVFDELDCATMAREITFRAPCTLREFLEERHDGAGKPGQALARAVTLTGTTSDAQALPCSEYVNQTWPVSGKHVLATISEAMDTESQATGNDHLLVPSRATHWEMPRRLGRYVHLRA